jgi:hypothetical protein
MFPAVTYIDEGQSVETLLALKVENHLILLSGHRKRNGVNNRSTVNFVFKMDIKHRDLIIIIKIKSSPRNRSWRPIEL